MTLMNKNVEIGSKIVWAFVAFLGFIFLTGGSSRGDIQSLILLRPVAIIMLGIGLWFLTLSTARRYKPILYITFAILLLVILHLIPLPPSIWQMLPQGELYGKVDKLAGLADVYRPLSMVPPATWNAFYALMVPLAVLFWVMQVEGDGRRKLILGLVIIGMMSCLLGLLQIIGPSKGPFYLYRITNNGAAVGFFANRNHHAVFLSCMFPLLAVYATTFVQTQEQAQFRRWTALLCSALVLPMILITGSRAGIATALIGIASVPLLWKLDGNLAPAKRKTQTQFSSFLSQHFNKIFIGVGGLLLVAATVYFSRAMAFDRLSGLDGKDDLRFDLWSVSWTATKDYLPLGSGIGSFVEVFQIYEPDALLNRTYVNHAHNDWVESVMTGGIPAFLIISALVLMWVWSAYILMKGRNDQSSTAKLARMGLVVTFILAAASFFDYPLRVPSLSALFVLMAIWLCDGVRRANITGTP